MLTDALAAYTSYVETDQVHMHQSSKVDDEVHPHFCGTDPCKICCVSGYRKKSRANTVEDKEIVEKKALVRNGKFAIKQRYVESERHLRKGSKQKVIHYTICLVATVLFAIA